MGSSTLNLTPEQCTPCGVPYGIGRSANLGPSVRVAVRGIATEWRDYRPGARHRMKARSGRRGGFTKPLNSSDPFDATE